MNVLILGGTGILSYAVANSMVNSGHKVTIVTDGKGSRPEPLGIQKHIILDRNDAKALQKALDNETEWDLVVDAICYNSDQAGILAQAIGERSRHTIAISTSILYAPNPQSEQLEHRLSPDGLLLEPKDIEGYEKHKRSMEEYWIGLWEETGHPLTILRLPHIMGVGCNLGIIPMHNRDPLLVQRLLSQQPLLLANGGNQQLQMVFNEDVAQVIMAASGKSETFGKIYNCANPEVFTAFDYFTAIADALGVPLEFETVPLKALKASNWGWITTTEPRLLDIGSLQQDIGIVPNTPMREAISQCVEHLLIEPTQLNEDEHREYLIRLDEIQRLLSYGKPVSANLLSACAELRPKNAVDLRMNPHLEKSSYKLVSLAVT